MADIEPPLEEDDDSDYLEYDDDTLSCGCCSCCGCDCYWYEDFYVTYDDEDDEDY